MFLLLHRVKYRKKLPLGTGTEFQVPYWFKCERYPTLLVIKVHFQVRNPCLYQILCLHPESLLSQFILISESSLRCHYQHITKDSIKRFVPKKCNCHHLSTPLCNSKQTFGTKGDKICRDDAFLQVSLSGSIVRKSMGHLLKQLIYSLFHFLSLMGL